MKITKQELFDRQFQNEPVSQPCSASCMHHHSHPCERCGRQWGNVIPLNQHISDFEAEAIKWQNLFLKLTKEHEDLEAKYHNLENHHADCLSRASDKIKEKVMRNEALRAVNDYTRNLKVSGMTGENNPNCKCQGGWTCPSCRYVIETVCSLKNNRIAELEAELAEERKKVQVLAGRLAWLASWHCQLDELRWQYVTDNQRNEAIVQLCVMEWPQLQGIAQQNELRKMSDNKEFCQEWATAKAKESE